MSTDFSKDHLQGKTLRSIVLCSAYGAHGRMLITRFDAYRPISEFKGIVGRAKHARIGIWYPNLVSSQVSKLRLKS